MDSELQDRWKSGELPFDGDCLYLDDFVKLSELRSLLIVFVDLLIQSHGAIQIYRFDDWHEHDGYISPQLNSNWETIRNALANDESLYTERHTDDYVYQAYYPSDYSFLLRFDILDPDCAPEYPGIWGRCDLCVRSQLIENIKGRLPKPLSRRLAIMKAKDYFDKNYAG